MQLELNPTQKWLVMQGLSLLSTPQGVVHLQAQYPNVNIKGVAIEMIELLKKFEADEDANEPSPKVSDDEPQR